ncbi:MAG: DUF2156 domain-containing protein [Desulfovibrionaceae bacterium]|nr:DUF2156 domain-containing protein [Desulfovibrionaceae bacterium]
MEWHPVDEAFEAVHGRYWEATPVHAADCTFTNLYGWAGEYRLQWSEFGGLLFLGSFGDGPAPDSWWMPLGDWDLADWGAVLGMLPPGCVWERVPERLCAQLAALCGKGVRVEETPEQWEYVYEQQALAALRGNKLHRKKNHVNAFVKQYGVDYRELGPEDAEAIEGFLRQWMAQRQEVSEALLAEYRVQQRILRLWPRCPFLKSAGLFVEGAMAAFSMGEPLDAETMVVHFEKGLAAYRGVYQAMNMFFAARAGAGFAFINREQDAGEEGLRAAKQSYYPCAFVRKNRVVFS